MIEERRIFEDFIEQCWSIVIVKEIQIRTDKYGRNKSGNKQE